ncbi:hypothetical protein Agub_g5824, partial [Astrephomene gubernaculifera]
EAALLAAHPGEEQQRRNADSAAATSSTASYDSSVLQGLLAALAATGCPVGLLLEIAAAVTLSSSSSSVTAAAYDSKEAGAAVTVTAPTAAVEVVSEAVGAAVDAALEGIMREAADADAGAGGDAGRGVDGDGMTRLRGVVACLETQPVATTATAADDAPAADARAGREEGPAAAAAPAAAAKTSASAHGEVAAPPPPPAEVLRSLRDVAWRRLQGFTEGRLAALERLMPAAAARLLDLQASLGTCAVWADWSGGASADPHAHRLRVLLSRTRGLLSHLEPPAPPISPLTEIQPTTAAAAAAGDTASALEVALEDVESCEAAGRFFERLMEGVRQQHGSTAGKWQESKEGGEVVAVAPLRPEQLRLLWRLLAEVWQDGAVWSSGGGEEEGRREKEEEGGNGDAAAAPEEQLAKGGQEAPGGGDVSDVSSSSSGGSGDGSSGKRGVSPLQRCWRLLAGELLRAGQLRELLRLLDPFLPQQGLARPAEASAAATAAQDGSDNTDISEDGAPAPSPSAVQQPSSLSPRQHPRKAPLLPLSETDMQNLIATAAAASSSSFSSSEGGIAGSEGTTQAAAVPADTATAAGITDTAAGVAWCLGLASPYPEQRRRALQDLLRPTSAAGAAFASAATDADVTVASSGEAVRQHCCCHQPPAEDVAVLLLTLLVRSGDVLRLAEPVAADAAATSCSPCHPLLPRLVALLPAAPPPSSSSS